MEFVFASQTATGGGGGGGGGGACPQRLPPSIPTLMSYTYAKVGSSTRGIGGNLFSTTLFTCTELPHDGNAAASAFNVLFDLFDDLIVILFTIEIVLKWLDNFKEFWKDLWNISDLVITVVVRTH